VSITEPFPGFRIFSIRLRLFALLVILSALIGWVFFWPVTVRSHKALVIVEKGFVQPMIVGRVARVNVALGSEVSAGDVVVELDSAKLWLELEEVQAKRDGAEARYKAALERKPKKGKKPNLQPLEEEFAVQETRVAILEEELERYRLRSPIDGVVTGITEGLLGKVPAIGETLMQVSGWPSRVVGWFEPWEVLGWITPGAAARVVLTGRGEADLTTTAIGGVEEAGVRVEFSASEELSGLEGLPGTITMEQTRPSYARAFLLEQ
jgi:multidrug resistance efflux pump